MDRQELDVALIQAHECHDLMTLVRLYTLAADQSESVQDIDAACFYLTHAFVFALEGGIADADELNRRLAERGRSIRLKF